MKQLVTVIIPTYNRSRELAVALESVRKQTYQDWEAIVVDNRSSDNTREVVGRFDDPRIKFIEITNNGVIAASRNLGIRHARGEFVAFLDSDDFWAGDKLEKSVHWMNQGFDVVYHDMRIASSKRVYVGQRRYLTRQLVSPVLNDLVVNGNALPTSSVVTRKDILVKVNGFREDMAIIAGEDYDCWLRISTVTQRFKRIDGTLGCLMRGGSNEFSSRRLISIISEIERRYVSALSRGEQGAAHANWIDYAYARAQFNQANYDDARGMLIKILASSDNLIFRIKAMVMLIAIAIRKGAGLSKS